jgi:nicotinamide phosphoribosyltransferase
MGNMFNPLFGIDFYKADHRNQYPKGTTEVFSNWTARNSRIEGVNEVVFFGLQYYLLKYLEDDWNDHFFYRRKNVVVDQYWARLEASGIHVDVKHIEDLYDLGYLPLEFWALPEGTHVPLKVPMFVVRNTLPEFFWLTNYIETQMSSVLWGPCTSATIAARYKKLFVEALETTGGPVEFADIQGHDFSYRGMYGTEAAALSGAGHLTSFKGSDTVPALEMVNQYYHAPFDSIGGSIPATEHSVMCMGTKENERETFRRLIQDVYPKGPVSIVSDTWDYWKILTDTIPSLKNEILARDGMLVIRPDSGDPVKIICGDPDAHGPANLGTVQLLWNIFGGTITDKGYKLLDPHIGAIYGDSITYERAEEITRNLIDMGFVPTVVFGIGSYTYQYVTRDTFGFAMKATAGVVDGEFREIFKDPVTDDGTKRSLKGYIAVYHDENGQLYAKDQATWEEVQNCAFALVWRNGTINTHTWNTLVDVRKRVEK